jgi:hypothetical protein
VARILALVSDLMLSSRVRESLLAAGHEVSVKPTLPDPLSAEVIVCDLDAVNAKEIASTGVPSLGFYSHLDHERRARAKQAGIDTVVPRSRMARELPELIDALLKRP